MNYTLLTDLYQLTMSYGYWKHNLHNYEAVFHLFFRKNPFKGKYAIAAGLETVIAFIEHFHFAQDDIDYLATLKGNDGNPLFEAEFLHYLSELKFDCSIDAIPEGTIVFPHQPLLRIRGNIILCQLLETPLLNILNFQTLIATKAARVCAAAKGESVLEFGLRRAQGKDGALSASRAAYIGGCAATSNVLAGKLFHIPIKGTHAHSWVMSFDEEMTAFEKYADAMPNNCVFLVDTYNTLEGVKKAIKVAKKLRETGHEAVGIRLDSGDLAQLSIEARKLMDEAGFPAMQIVASNDLDEYEIEHLKQKGAKIDIWGVGTKLVTAYDQPALGGVYKLSAIRAPHEAWKFRVKLSEQAIKVSNPGILQVKRYMENGKPVGDMIFSEIEAHCQDEMLTFETNEKVSFSQNTTKENLLVSIFDKGEKSYTSPSLSEIRALSLNQVALFEEISNYKVGLETTLYELKMKMIAARQ